MKNVCIIGAAGRDFHNFLVCFKDNPEYHVVAFTAAQIPGIENRSFPKKLAGGLYKKDIPILPESRLQEIIKKYHVDDAVFAYSDVLNEYVMGVASKVLSSGANFKLLGPEKTMLASKKPVISVNAVRTGAGKSPVTRKIAGILKAKGIRCVVVRHPMPYGDLVKQSCQRFAKVEDLKRHKCTIEESEDYMPLIESGHVVYAGVDYKKILQRAEREADVIVFDGGNNDWGFFKPDLLIVLADAKRPGHEISYYPGSVNLRMADVIIINKVGKAESNAIKQIEGNIKKLNPEAVVIKSDMPISLDSPRFIKGKSVLAVSDGPTLTHGGLSHGAAFLAANKYKAREIVDPRPYAVGSIKKIFSKYKHLGPVLPALGYGRKQLQELQKTINNVPCDSVIIGTPVDLRKFIKINKPVVRVTYNVKEVSGPSIASIINKFIKNKKIR